MCAFSISLSVVFGVKLINQGSLLYKKLEKMNWREYFNYCIEKLKEISNSIKSLKFLEQMSYY
jgi:hypothetical protein